MHNATGVFIRVIFRFRLNVKEVTGEPSGPPVDLITLQLICHANDVAEWHVHDAKTAVWLKAKHAGCAEPRPIGFDGYDVEQRRSLVGRCLPVRDHDGHSSDHRRPEEDLKVSHAVPQSAVGFST